MCKRTSTDVHTSFCYRVSIQHINILHNLQMYKNKDDKTKKCKLYSKKNSIGLHFKKVQNHNFFNYFV